jgi:hypothetical protein
MIPWLREELLTYRAAVGTPDLDAPVFPTRDGAHRTKDNVHRNVIGPVVRAANDARRERGMPPLPVAVTAHRPVAPDGSATTVATWDANSPARRMPTRERTVGRASTSIGIPSCTAATRTSVSRATRGASSW